MSVPSLTEREEVVVDTITFRVQDPEIDRQADPPRILWSLGVPSQAANRLLVADIVPVVGPAGGQDLQNQRQVHTVANEMNPGEWGRMVSAPAEIGILYPRHTGLSGDVTVWEAAIPERQPMLVAATPQLAFAGTLGVDTWLLDAWREMAPGGVASNDPLLLFVRVAAGGDVTQGTVWLFDPNRVWGNPMDSAVLYRVPNFELWLETRGSRGLNIVPDYPAIVLIHYQFPPGGGDPLDWELRWQEVNGASVVFGGQSFYAFGSRQSYATDTVIGVDVQKLEAVNVNGVTPTYELYFVYVLRRHFDGYIYTDHIDYYLFDYDYTGVGVSTDILSGTAPFPTTNVAGHQFPYSFIGDNESYVDPERNPCIVNIANPEPGNADQLFGILVLFTFDWVNVLPGGGAPGGGDPWRFDVLTPAGAATERARKDPEPVTIKPDPAVPGTWWTYVYNRYSKAGDLLGAPWGLQRTLTWKRRRM